MAAEEGGAVRRCRTCCMPASRPDVPFDSAGQCQACTNYQNRPTIDWDQRKKELIALLDRHDGRCIVPSSGGKDSTAQVMALLNLGADVTVVTATTCHLTTIGRHNIDNLARYARTIEVSPNKTVRAKLNKAGLEMVGDISWIEHVSIFTTPFKMALDLGIPLIFYGENPQECYGGPPGSEEARTMTRRWVSEFGGFLGLRPSDLVGYKGIAERDMRDYMPPIEEMIQVVGVEAHFLGQYLPWDSHKNAEVALLAGMKAEYPSPSNWWRSENQDNAQTGLHDHMMFRKYGFGRGCAQISVDVRAGLISRDEAMKWVRTFDGGFPMIYAGVHINQVLERLGMTIGQLYPIMDRFTNWKLFRRVEDDHAAMPMILDWGQ